MMNSRLVWLFGVLLVLGIGACTSTGSNRTETVVFPARDAQQALEALETEYLNDTPVSCVPVPAGDPVSVALRWCATPAWADERQLSPLAAELIRQMKSMESVQVAYQRRAARRPLLMSLMAGNLLRVNNGGLLTVCELDPATAVPPALPAAYAAAHPGITAAPGRAILSAWLQQVAGEENSDRTTIIIGMTRAQLGVLGDRRMSGSAGVRGFGGEVAVSEEARALLQRQTGSIFARIVQAGPADTDAMSR